MTVHNFVESNRKGKVGESILSAFFTSKGNEVHLADLTQQKQEHWDLRLVKEGVPDKYVEVKTEYKAETTGNVFWEMEVNGKNGWTQLYKENELPIFIAWLLPTSRIVYILSSHRLEYLTKLIEDEFPHNKREVINETGISTYVSWGYLVPVSFLSKYAKRFNL